MTQMPRFVYLRPSSIPGAGMGVWAQEPIPAGTRFGPYTGNNVNSIGYAWKVSESWGYWLFGYLPIVYHIGYAPSGILVNNGSIVFRNN